MYRMSLCSMKLGGSVFTGLLAILFCSIAGDASAQSSTPNSPGTYPNSLRSDNAAEMPGRFTHRSPSGGSTEIVEGGVYYDDGKGGLVPSGSAAARAIAGPTASKPVTAPTTRPAARSASPAVRSASAPVGRRVSRQTAAPADETVVEPSPGPTVEHMTMSGSGAFGDESCGDCCLEPCCAFPLLPLDNLELSAGVQGFTGPANRGSTGSFGFNEAINWGVPFPLLDNCLGLQLGARATQSNLSGADFTENDRTQLFVTGGLFRRVDVGLQGGIVFDYLNDSWYRNVALTQLRGELSWVFGCQDDLGFWFTASSGSATADSTTRQSVITGGVPTIQLNTTTETWQGTDLYAFFYRRQFGECREGEARIFGGFTNQSDGLVGVDARFPLSDTWALETGFIYLAPKQGSGIGLDAGHAQEGWNLGINLVWVPGRAWGQADSRYSRPLFRVADNGVFMMDRQ